MNWKPVILLSLLGVAMGIAATLGLTRKIEPLLWLAIAIVAALVLGAAHVPKPFLHGLLVGLFAGVLAAVIEAIFFPTYLSNNPEAAAQFTQSPINPRLLILAMSPVIGAAFGAAAGLFTWLAGKFVFRG